MESIVALFRSFQKEKMRQRQHIHPKVAKNSSFVPKMQFSSQESFFLETLEFHDNPISNFDISVLKLMK